MNFLESGKFSMSTYIRKLRLVALHLILLSSSTAAIAVTPEQLQQLQQLPSSQQAAILQQVQSTPSIVNVPASVPVQSTGDAVKPRDTGVGKLEAAPVGVDEQKAAAEAQKAPATNVPVVEVASQKAADKQETRRSFEDFLREAKPMTVDTQNLQQFGYDLFAGQPTTFEPVTNVPVPPEYVLGPGDEIKVQLFGKDNVMLTLAVDREGSVAFPQVGPIALAGLSFAQAKTMLSEMIAQKMIGNTANITMGQLRSIRIFALGDVFKPGSYTVSGLATLSHALFSSGGVKKMGSLRNIQLKRNGQPIVSLDLYDFLLRGDTSKDRRLLPGDVVFVPPLTRTISIAGQVARPAIYEIKNEKTVSEILRLAGGLMPNAYLDRALIERLDGKGEKKIVSINLSNTGLRTFIQNGDVIKVFSGSEFETNQVLLIGNVKRPGTHAWEKGMRVSSVIASMDDLMPESFMDYGIIEREAPGNREPMLMRFRLNEILAQGGKNSEVDISLQPRDKVFVFKRANFRQQPKVTIAGSVQNGGEYELKRNMHLADLVLAAGGILRDTDLGMVEVYRTDPLSKKIDLIKANLAQAMNSGSGDDLLLQDLDRVVVHSVYETQLRKVVTVAGQVNKPDTVPLSQGMRVADLVFAGGSVTEFAFLKKARLTRYVLDKGEKRAVKHFNIDLSAALHGDEAANILLEPYDALFVTRINDEPNLRDIVAIAGEVLHPDSVPLVDGMRVSDLVFAGGGLTDSVYLEKAEITRYAIENGERRVSDHFEINLGAAMRGDQSANVLLKPYDILNVRRLGNWRVAEQVEVIGEVAHPGKYPVEEGERLSSLLSRVGGFTKHAYLPAVVFTRESVRQEQERQIAELARRMEGELAQLQASNSTTTDELLKGQRQNGLDAAKRVLAQLQGTKATGRVVIQLDDIEELKDSELDVRLRAGDKIIVPKQPDEILVIGEVYSQNAMLFNSSSSRDEYVRQAGPTRMADTDAVYVIHVNGQVDEANGGFFSSGRKLGPGDTIIVPPDLRHVNALDIALDWSRALMQIGMTMATGKAIGIFK
ncbi:MAG: SLBB domain-containing protein [Gallionella sp.]